MENRPPIPEPIKRAVRQKCGYGCVVCGSPFYQIDHLEHEWYECKTHEASNLFLLCPSHHAEKTKKLLSVEKVLKNFNSLHRKTTTPYTLHIEECSLSLGNNVVSTFPGTLFKILEFGELSAEVEDDLFLFSGTFLNADGTLAFSLQRNEIVLNSQFWDIEFSGKTITFRNKPREIFIKLEIDIPNRRLGLTGIIPIGPRHNLRILDSGLFVNHELLMSECRSENNYKNIGVYVYDSKKETLSGSWGFGKCMGITNCRGNGFVWSVDFLRGEN